jgi:hypothetical protein
MTTSLNEEAVQCNESLECDPTIVDSIWTVLLHHSLSQDIREVIRGRLRVIKKVIPLSVIPRLFIFHLDSSSVPQPVTNILERQLGAKFILSWLLKMIL